VQTKRGCALRCSYCTYRRIEGCSYRLRSPEKIVEEISELVGQTGVRHVEFTDSTFNIPLEHAKTVLRALIASGLDLRLRAMGLNPGAVDEELADLLVTAGFRDADLGVESGCDRTLRSLGKSFTREDVKRAGKLLRERRIPSIWYLLVGSEGETEETLAETFATIREAVGPWDLITVGVGVRVYNGSRIADELRERGHPGASDNFFKPVAVRPQGLLLDAVKQLTRQEALRRDNWFMYDEGEQTPVAAMRFFTFVNRLLGLDQPLWRGLILIRKLQRYAGFGILRRALGRCRFRRPRPRRAGSSGSAASGWA
jgi:hypothetical protein